MGYATVEVLEKKKEKKSFAVVVAAAASSATLVLREAGFRESDVQNS